MASNDFILTDNYQEVADGSSLITLELGEYCRLHIAAAGPPADDAPAHSFLVEKGVDRGFPYDGTEKVFARKLSRDNPIVVKLTVTPNI